jgi:hypothetical protein
MMAAFTAPIEVPATISIWIFCFTSALKTPHAKDPKEPPPYIMRTFSKDLVLLCLDGLSSFSS